MRATTAILGEWRAQVTRVAMLCGVTALAACAPSWPETGYSPSAEARAAPDPALLTGAQMAAALNQGGTADAQRISAGLSGRAAALRARARVLDRPVIPPAERRRLMAAAEAARLRLRAAN